MKRDYSTRLTKGPGITFKCNITLKCYFCQSEVTEHTLTFPSPSLHILISKIRHPFSSHFSQASSRCHTSGGGDKVSQSGPVLELRRSTTVGGVAAVGEETPHAPEQHGSIQMDPAGWTRTRRLFSQFCVLNLISAYTH